MAPSVIGRALTLIRLFRSKHSHFNVKPRYTCGSPAAVSQEDALYQANEELVSLQHDLEGVHGEEHQARARSLGLGPAREGDLKCPNCCFIQPDPAVTLCVACTWRLDTSVNDGSHYSPVELVVEHSNHWMVICLMTGEIFTLPFADVKPSKVEGCKKCRAARDQAAYQAMEGSYS
jgi:hypothetical protein